MTNLRRCEIAVAKDGEDITEASLEIGDEKWFRLTVTDEKGYKAYTNAYFTDTL